MSRERTVPERLDALAERLRLSPSLAARTLDAVHGRIPAPDLTEGTAMAAADERKGTSLRIPQGLLDRADALVGRLAGDPLVAALGQVTRAKVLVLALAKGLEALEREQPTPRRRR